jgi:hypothetical protein
MLLTQKKKPPGLPGDFQFFKERTLLS